MPRELRGTRYLTGENHWLSRFIIEDLPYLDFEETRFKYRTLHTYKRFTKDPNNAALLGCNDRYYLLTGLLGRKDAVHPWLFDRCREVEADPDGYIDLWARFHYKSSIITFAGCIQEVLRDPEITIAIFSVIKPIAGAFLAQIKDEFENNEHLKEVYPDVLYSNPRTRGPDGRPAKWSLARGLTVKRKGNPKEATIEAHGLLDGQPTSRHFNLHVYDDVVTQDFLSDESIRKTTARWEMADNLGSHLGVRKWMPATRYHYADTCGVVIERGSLKPRIYPATDDGLLTGKPVFLSPKRWDEIKRDQRSTVSAQLLLNPIAGSEATFRSTWLHTYEVFPAVMNVYILVDPSKGSGERSDRTAIAIIGIDQGGNKYLLDGMRHRCKLTERWEFIKAARKKWLTHPGVQDVKVGYERYGAQVDTEVIEDLMNRENEHFLIEELNTPKQGGHSKNDRIERLEPDIREGRFYLPCVAHNPDHGGLCYWSVWTEEHEKRREAQNLPKKFSVGQVIYRKMINLSKRQQECEATAQRHRIVTAIKRRDENNDVYDVTRAFVDEMVKHPFGQYEDLLDAASRIYDLEPEAPIAYEASSTEPLGLDNEDLFGAG
jgi:hypothetical protein